METTIKDIIEQIEIGKVEAIYFSQYSLWWTHDPMDLNESTEWGKKNLKKQYKKHIRDPKLSQSQKNMMTRLFNEQQSNKMILDPTGGAILMTKDPKKWIESVNKSDNFMGRKLYEIAEVAHHKNCEGYAFGDWKYYKMLLDEKEKKAKK